MHSRFFPLRAALFVVVLGMPFPSIAARKGHRAEVPAPDPAAFAMIGSAAPADRVAALSAMLRAASLPGAQVAADLPLFAVLKDVGGAGTPRYEASDVALVVGSFGYGERRIEHARIALMPSADGRSCRFEMSGSPFGDGSTMEASGTLVWAAGPLGGDNLDVTFSLRHAPVDALREAYPDRFDPSLRGFVDVSGNASGVVGEETTEDAPATPLRGDLHAGVDWQILGRTAPAQLAVAFSLDDKSLRIRSGRLEWQGLAVDLSGWLDPQPNGKFEVVAKWKDVDAHKVATDWNVPEPWRPVTTLSGSVTLAGTPGKGILRYETFAPSVALQGLDGYPIRLDDAKILGSLLAVNVDVSASILATQLRVGDLSLVSVPVGLQWWRDKFSVTTTNSHVWGGNNDGSLSYKPANHPAWSMAGRIESASAIEMAAGAAPWLGLDVDGAAAVAYAFGQDEARIPIFSLHTSLVLGRFGSADLFAAALSALGAADPALVLADAASLTPKPRKGSGTRVDKLFTEVEKKGDGFDLGGLYLRAGDFQLDADGHCTRDGLLHLDGTIVIPAQIADRLVAAAPWFASLRSVQGLFVPVILDGKASAPTLTLAPAYIDAIARAKQGGAVDAPAVKVARHVGADNMASIPADPTILNLE